MGSEKISLSWAFQVKANTILPEGKYSSFVVKTKYNSTLPLSGAMLKQTDLNRQALFTFKVPVIILSRSEEVLWSSVLKLNSQASSGLIQTGTMEFSLSLPPGSFF